MVSDDERHRVAERLRELARDVDEVSDFDLARALGLEATSRYGYDSGDVLRLADLIEPSRDRYTPQKAAEEMFGKMRHSTKEEADAYDAMLKSKSVEIHPVDRDALLALADEIEYGASSDDGEYHDLPATMVAAVARKQMEYARSIREACGEAVA